MASLFLVVIFGYVYWAIKDQKADYEKSLTSLKNSGKLVDVTILGDIKSIGGGKRTAYYTYTQISYKDIITNKVVKRYVFRCKRSSTRDIDIGCMVKGDKPLKMLYVPGDDKMWSTCEKLTTIKNRWLCSGGNLDTYSVYAPFTFDVEQFK